MLYKSNRDFKILAYTISHSSLLLRSDMMYPEQEEYSPETSFNIDVEIWDTSYIGIPIYLNNIVIRKITIDLLPSDIDKELCRFDRKIFEITSNQHKYYIIAGGLLIATNRWENKDRIFNYGDNLEHDEITLKA